ncbi:MAG: hypothetical protein AAF412_03480, partial [Pseudomonadota bacterium]
FKLAKRHEAEAAAQVVVIGQSSPKAALPLITSKAHSSECEALLACVRYAVDTLSQYDREALVINGVVPATSEDYRAFVSSQSG